MGAQSISDGYRVYPQWWLLAAILFLLLLAIASAWHQWSRADKVARKMMFFRWGTLTCIFAYVSCYTQLALLGVCAVAAVELYWNSREQA